ncbi:unnamed protein product [Pseudo-nitzschia multistriata]|uniref:peptide-methionine (S)-S-oxide reductase n=1 Tax=Pseudo-nitzschia multistriata TaxID=183589 RepID=A0A448ZAH1_9STRA|nr:unnamed protein product [Pseudo-nitzschia multistriata]
MPLVLVLLVACLCSIPYRCQAFLPAPVSVRADAGAAAPLRNFLSDWLGSLQDSMNTGGSYNLGIDYEALEYPGPEVGKMALEIAAGERAETTSTSTSSTPRDGGFVSSLPPRLPSDPRLELATLAGGCFWGLQLALQRTEGVEVTLVGYTRGPEARPNYDMVSAGNTSHREAVLVGFDPEVVSFGDLLRTAFLARVDLSQAGGQGRDVGDRYATGIYCHALEQEEEAARLLREEVATNPRYRGRSLATEVAPAAAFWPAEGHHQRYLEKGGRFGRPQSAEKGCTEEIRCYG